MVDATVSKTVELKGSCQFDSGLRHHIICNTIPESISLVSQGAIVNGSEWPTITCYVRHGFYL